MKKMPLLIVIPLVAILIIVAIAMGIKVFTPAPIVSVTKPSAFPNAITTADSASKPTTFLGSLFGQHAPTPTPSPATAADLSTQLKNTYDDGGQSDMDALNRDAGTL